MGLYFAVDTIKQYCADASVTVLVGAPPTPLMVSVRNAILTKMNAVYQLMDTKVATAIVAAAPERSSSEFVWTKYYNSTGMPSTVYVCIIGLLTSLYGMSGYEAAS
jgi:hypothetical protein